MRLATADRISESSVSEAIIFHKSICLLRMLSLMDQSALGRWAAETAFVAARAGLAPIPPQRVPAPRLAGCAEHKLRSCASACQRCPRTHDPDTDECQSECSEYCSRARAAPLGVQAVATQQADQTGRSGAARSARLARSIGVYRGRPHLQSAPSRVAHVPIHQPAVVLLIYGGNVCSRKDLPGSSTVQCAKLEPERDRLP